jgi:hypothetical protein
MSTHYQAYWMWDRALGVYWGCCVPGTQQVFSDRGWPSFQVTGRGSYRHPSGPISRRLAGDPSPECMYMTQKPDPFRDCWGLSLILWKPLEATHEALEKAGGNCMGLLGESQALLPPFVFPGDSGVTNSFQEAADGSMWEALKMWDVCFRQEWERDKVDVWDFGWQNGTWLFSWEPDFMWSGISSKLKVQWK